VRPRIAILFFAAVLAPLAAVAWLTIRNAAHEERALGARVDALLDAELAALARQVGASMDSRAKIAGRVLDGLRLDAASIREAVREEPCVKQIFVIDSDGALLHPPVDAPRNEGEEAFLRRTERIWATGEAFYRPSDRPGAQGGERSGWYTWYWGDDINFIYWRLDDAGRVRGAELDRMALLAEIVGELPTTSAKGAAETGRIELANANGASIYVFGRYEPPAGTAPRAARELAPPLAAFRLRAYPNPELLGRNAGASARRSAFLAAAALILAVGAIAITVFRAAGREAREARLRVGFVNQVSHELKTPLTNIRMYAEMLEREIDDEDTRPRRHLSVIVSESRRLSRLIGNVLTLARAQRKTLAVRATEGRADAAIAAVLDQFAPSLSAAGFEVVAEIEEDAPSLVDEDAVGQIIGNLIGNVEKYAAKGKWLRVSSRREGDAVFVEVADRGPGIPAKQRERIFAPFYRLSASIAEGASGTGIGLTISRDLARLHGGDLEVVPSERGAVFRLALRAPRAAGGAP
jgi:signal transduction histidine kinase